MSLKQQKNNSLMASSATARVMPQYIDSIVVTGGGGATTTTTRSSADIPISFDVLTDPLVVSSTSKSQLLEPLTTAKLCNDRCVELALEGERRCRAGDPKTGVAYLEAALTAGTDDLRTLSAIYSQLGNAYFYMGDYIKALEYHRHDVTLARTIGDRAGEAKASGNLGNTLKVLGKHDEAVVCCLRHLEISRELNDKVGESRALYNLGNVYHAKGKHIGRLANYEAGEYPQEVRSCLLKAVEYYERNLRLVQELNDKAAEGRACGNLGNTFYLLGDFNQAVCHHLQRLNIAKQFGDKPAMRRAYSNLGNAHVFLGEFEQAVECYKQALAIAIELGDAATEAQACYSLGNTATLLGEHEQAIEYHIRHLSIARQLSDRVGQARAAWSLGNAFMSLGQHSKSLYFVMLHMQLSAEIGDLNGESIAEQNLSDLGQILGTDASPNSNADPAPVDLDKSFIESRRSRRRSFDRLDSTHCNTQHGFSSLASGDANNMLNLPTADARRSSALSVNHVQTSFENTPEDLADEDTFFEFISRAQSKRMDDQRCDPKALVDNKENRPRIRASDAPRVQSSSRRKSPANLLTTGCGETGRRSLSTLLSKSLLSLHRSTVERSRRTFSTCKKPKNIARQQLAVYSELDLSNENRQNQYSTPLCTARNFRSDLSLHADSLNREQGPEEFLDLVIGIQSRRMDDQRAMLPELPGLQHPAQVLGPHILMAAQHRHEQQQQQQQQRNGSAPTSRNEQSGGGGGGSGANSVVTLRRSSIHATSSGPVNVVTSSVAVVASDGGLLSSNSNSNVAAGQQIDDDFIDMLIRCQSTRIDEQRSELPDRSKKGITVPDEDFFQLVLKLQARRLEEQRANLNKDT